MRAKKNLISLTSVLLPLLLLGASGLAALPKNPSFHGVTPHPYLVVGIFLFYLLEFRWSLILGPALAIQYLLLLHFTVDYDEVITLWSYTYLSLPGSLMLLTFGIGILKSIRDQELIGLKLQLTQFRQKDEKSQELLQQSMDKLKDLEIRMSLENRGVPEILSKFENLMRSPDNIQQLGQLVRNYFRESELKTHLIIEGNKNLQASDEKRALIEYILSQNPNRITLDKQLPLEWQTHHPSNLYFPLIFEKIPIGVIELSGAHAQELTKETMAIVQRIFDLWSWALLQKLPAQKG